jgi:hypothetical protein
MQRRMLPIAAGPAIAGLLLLAACTVPDRFADRAVDYNRSLEDAENRGLLLNVLRAANDRPLYFTSFTALRGSMSVSLGANAAATIGLDGGNSTSLGGLISPNASIVNSPSFDLAVLDTQAFARGLLTPIDNDVLDVFYQQDRDMRRLLDLFVSRIDVVLRRAGAGERAVFYRARYWNDPLYERRQRVDPGVRDGGRTEFRCARSVLASAGLELRQSAPLVPVGVTVPVLQLGGADAIANALKAGLRFRPVPGRVPQVELLQLGGAAAFVFPGEPRLETGPALPTAREMVDHADGGLSLYQVNSVRLGLRVRPGGVAGDRMVVVVGDREVPIAAEPSCEPLAQDVFAAAAAGGGVATGEMDAEFVLFVRSTEGVVRYVGHRLCARYGPPVCGAAPDNEELPDEEILTLAPATDSPTLAAVELDGQRFALSLSDHTSARTMAQLKQLIALHNRAEQAPATAAVTVVGTGSSVQAR